MDKNNHPEPAQEPTQDESVQGRYGIKHVASGQKVVIFAAGAYMISFFLPEVVAQYFGVLAVGIGILGIVIVATGLGYGKAAVMLYVIGMLIPLVGLVVLLVLNDMAIRTLRENGYEVGLLRGTKMGQGNRMNVRSITHGKRVRIGKIVFFLSHCCSPAFAADLTNYLVSRSASVRHSYRS